MSKGGGAGVAPESTKGQQAVERLSELVPDRSNRRKHNARNIAMVADALKSVGAARSIVIDEDNVVLAGNGVLEGAAVAGITRVRVIEADGQEVIAVRRSGLTPKQKRDLALYDNRTNELSEWNVEQLVADKLAGLDLQPFWTPAEEQAIAARAAAAEVQLMASAKDPAAEPEAPSAASEYQQFSCPLTTEQERIVRAALRAARTVFDVKTTGAALTEALAAWVRLHEAANRDELAVGIE